MILSTKQRRAIDHAARSIEVAITLRDALADRHCKRVHADMMQRLAVAQVSLGASALAVPSMSRYIEPVRQQLSQVQKRMEKSA